MCSGKNLPICASIHKIQANHVLKLQELPQKACQRFSQKYWHIPFTSVLSSVLHRDNLEVSMKSKHGQQYQRATVWTRGDRTAKPSLQLGAQIDRQDRHSICVYSSLWWCLPGKKDLFGQVKIVKDCVRREIQIYWKVPGLNIMANSFVEKDKARLLNKSPLFEPLLHLLIQISLQYNLIPNARLKTIQPLQRRRSFIYEMPALLCRESSGSTRSSTPECDLVLRISSVSL